MTSVLASGPLYTSGTFWGVVGVVLALATGAVSVVIWRFGPPRRLLSYSMPVCTSLLSTHSRGFGLASSGLEVNYQGQALSDPYVFTLSVDSRSRKDISSADFDQKRPLEFDVGVPIRAIVGDRGSVESPDDVVSISGSTVKIKPMLIHRGQVLQLNLLADGPPHLSCRSHLIDVKVIEQSSEEAQRRRIRIQSISLVVVLIALLAIVTPYVIEFFQHPGVTISAPADGSVVHSDLFRVLGTARNIPSNDDLWLVDRPADVGLWYPLARLALQNGGQWQVDVTKLLKGSHELVVIMVPISDEAALVNYIIAINSSRHPPAGLSSLPAGLHLEATTQIRAE